MTSTTVQSQGEGWLFSDAEWGRPWSDSLCIPGCSCLSLGPLAPPTPGCSHLCMQGQRAGISHTSNLLTKSSVILILSSGLKQDRDYHLDYQIHGFWAHPQTEGLLCSSEASHPKCKLRKGWEEIV